MALSVEIVGLHDFIEDARRAGADASKLVRAALINSTDRVQSNVRALAPHRTGTLQRSVLTQVNYPEGKVQVQEKYGAFIEEGTGIYGRSGTPITPKRAKALRWNGVGGVMFAKSVNGMRARPVFKPGVEKSQNYIIDQFTKVMERIIRETAGH